ncbi:MAG: hypothetical protein GOU99_03885, partial [Candidatus Altiarchaeota archaeon]|nr:hypothetical protein [Candidatus Altiarchaeota archaeon]
DANMILFEKGLRRTAETINAQRVKDGLAEMSFVEVLILPKKVKSERTPRHKIRNNIYSILTVSKKPLHGYAIYKKYNEDIGKISSRLVYYHLSRGLKEGFFEIVSSERVKGDFSWGTTSIRKLYGLKQQT